MLKYKMQLGGKRISGVYDVSETAKREIKEYMSISGESFCEDRGRMLKSWRVKIELCGYTRKNADQLLLWLEQTAQQGLVSALNISWDMGGISAWVKIKEIETGAICGDACEVSMLLVEYIKPRVSVVENDRAGEIPAPPANILAGNIFSIMNKYLQAGKNVSVKNPNTGVDVDNLSIVEDDTLLSLEYK